MGRLRKPRETIQIKVTNMWSAGQVWILEPDYMLLMNMNIESERPGTKKRGMH